MEAFLNFALLVGLLLAPCSYGQGLVTGTQDGSTQLQPWLVGLAAVTGFLGVVFVALLLNRLFFSKTKDEDDTSEEGKKREIELSVARNIYDNLAMEPDEGPLDSSDKKVEDKNTLDHQTLTNL